MNGILKHPLKGEEEEAPKERKEFLRSFNYILGLN